MCCVNTSLLLVRERLCSPGINKTQQRFLGWDKRNNQTLIFVFALMSMNVAGYCCHIFYLWCFCQFCCVTILHFAVISRTFNVSIDCSLSLGLENTKINTNKIPVAADDHQILINVHGQHSSWRLYSLMLSELRQISNKYILILKIQIVSVK